MVLALPPLALAVFLWAICNRGARWLARLPVIDEGAGVIDFCLSVGPRSLRPARYDAAVLLPNPPTSRIELAGIAPPFRAEVFWSSAEPFPDRGDRIRPDDGQTALLVGYPLTSDGQPIRKIADFDPDAAAGYGGDFLYLSIGKTGPQRICRSPVCSYPLYMAQADGVTILASRAALAFAALCNDLRPRVSADFARWVCTYGISTNRAGLFNGVTAVLPNQRIVLAPGKISILPADPAFLHDPAMREHHLRNPKSYWDEVYERLTAATAVLSLSHTPIEFALSGGKDSRLLLGLLMRGPAKDRLAKVYTNGPSISPDVRSAQLVCSALGLKHDRRDASALEEPRDILIDSRLTTHLHLTEAEMSPVDLTWVKDPRGEIALLGQEGGLRNMAETTDLNSRDAVWDWFRRHLILGDRCGMFLPGIADKNMAETRDFIDRAELAGVPLADIPALHSIHSWLGRWVARAWRYNNDRGFAPFLLVDSALIRATFNSGAASRQREEMHFEMLRRIEPRLLDIPFAETAWKPETAALAGITPLQALHWPNTAQEIRARPAQDAMQRHFPALQAFLERHGGEATDAVIDRDRLSRLSLIDLPANSYSALWQLAQIALCERLGSLAELGEGRPASSYGLPNFDVPA